MLGMDTAFGGGTTDNYGFVYSYAHADRRSSERNARSRPICSIKELHLSAAEESREDKTKV
jgi:hypothetical protein